MKKRLRLPRPERLQQILAAAWELFSTRPYDEVSTSEVAKRASVSEGLLYHYFPRKRDLFIAVLRSQLENFQLVVYGDPHLPVQKRIHQGLETTLALIETYPTLAQVVLRGGLGADQEIYDLLNEYRRIRKANVFSLLETQHPTPLFDLAIDGWISFFDQVCLRWIEKHDISREHVIYLLEQNLQWLWTLSSSEEKS